jgi:flavin reductase (DIM6/NTAB) family NADH-FMN oxidoreductase RutF
MSTSSVCATQARDETFDAREFRRALGCFPTGVAVITTRDADGTPVGLTCNSFSSVSLDPPLVLWSLRSNSRSLPAFRRAKAFAIHVLADHQQALSAHFAGSADNKFEGRDPTGQGLPLVEGSIARFCCDTVAEHEAGDHVIFIGQVASFSHHEQEPLVFYRGAYKAVADSLQDLVSRGQDSTAALNEARERVYGQLLQLACERATPDDLQQLDQQLREIDRCAAAGEMQQRAQAALAFFHRIGVAAHNPVLEVVAQSLGNLMKHKVSASASSMTWAELHQPALTPLRWRMLERLRARDADGAQAALRDYVQASPVATWGLSQPQPETA